ncbi:hypothetical protein ACH5RR_034735 [Cinchona calisaya]|uniref:Uncharacterized protein n=1 Tax=Cinchona calisaya TaxID=153742 RepID=A0ABD2YFP4_9GENT
MRQEKEAVDEHQSIKGELAKTKVQMAKIEGIKGHKATKDGAMTIVTNVVRKDITPNFAVKECAFCCTTDQKEEFALTMVSTNTINYDVDWIFDSRCSNHMTGDKRKLINLIEYKGGRVVVTTDNSRSSFSGARHILETLTYLARNHPFAAKILLEFRLPWYHQISTSDAETNTASGATANDVDGSSHPRVRKEKVAIAPVHRHLFMSELANSVQSLIKSKMDELRIFWEVDKALLSSTTTDGAAILRVLQFLSSLVATLNGKGRHILSDKDSTTVSLVPDINAALEPLWLELSTSINKMENYSDWAPDLLHSSILSISGVMHPLPAGSQNILPYIDPFF